MQNDSCEITDSAVRSGQIMKINGEFIIREFNGAVYAIATGESATRFIGEVKLNQTARILWEKLIEGADLDALTDCLLENYEIDRETAEKDVIRFTKELRSANLIIVE